MLTIAINNEMVSRNGDDILAEFLYDKQILPLNLSCALENKVQFKEDIAPIS